MLSSPLPRLSLFKLSYWLYRLGLYVCIPLIWLLPPIAFSEEGAENAQPPGRAQYVHLQPAFVLNYGDQPKGRLKYLRTDVALRVLGDAAAARVGHHTPYLRNQLVFLLSQQTDETVNTSQGREELRKQALEEVRATMVMLEGQPLVEDLYFQNFVVQN